MLLKYIRKRYMCTSTTAIKHTLSIKDIPKARGLPLIGTTLSFLASGSSNKIHRYIDKRHQELGSILRESIGPVEGVFISNADYMRTILTKLEGKYPMHFVPEAWTEYNRIYGCNRGIFFMHDEEWLHYRKIMNKLVLKPDTESWLTPPISTAVDNLIQLWKENSKNGIFKPEIPRELYKMSIEMTVSVALGSAYATSAHRFRDLLTKFSEKVYEIFEYSTKLVVMPIKYYIKLNHPAWKGFVKATNETMTLGKSLMDTIYNMDDLGNGLVSKMKCEGLNNEEISKIVLDFVIAAGDTSAGTIQWILYLLSTNPDVLSEYRKNLKNPEEEQKLSRGIIKEAMRLFPAAPIIARVLPNDCVLGEYMLPKGTIVMLSLFTSGRDPHYFTEPLRFNPKRWYKDDADSTTVAVSHATIPFAIGARSCIGRKIAMIELKQVLQKIVENFEIDLLNKNVEDVTRMILTPKEPLNVVLKRLDMEYN